jgi:hypothetical protein
MCGQQRRRSYSSAMKSVLKFRLGCLAQVGWLLDASSLEGALCIEAA